MALSLPVTPTAAAATSVTLPAHSAGQLILIFAYRSSSATQPTVPTAGGTVPTWTNISNPTGGSNSARMCYAVATANNHTSGTWTNATRIIAVVIDGQSASPIGGNTFNAGAYNTSTSAFPFNGSFSLTNTSGTSMVLRFFGVTNVSSGGYSAISGFTSQITSQTASSTGVIMHTKDAPTTSSGGSINQTLGASASGSYVGYGLEIIAQPTPSNLFFGMWN